MEGRFMTDTGKVRNHNEDAGGVFHNDSSQVLALIADGMGGHRAGDVASQMTADRMQTKWQHAQLSSPLETEAWLDSVLKEINQEVYAHSLKNKECRGMGTTIVAAICSEEFITIGHVGDSRCYVYADDKLNQVTKDHSLVNELVRSGEISKEDARHHPRKNVVLKALGTEEFVKPDIQSIDWKQGDMLLLCSDGLTDKLDDNEIETNFTAFQSIDDLGQKLIDLANDRGGEDNISLVIVQHQCIRAGDSTC